MSELLQLVSREEAKWGDFRCKWPVITGFYILQSVLFCSVPTQKKMVYPYMFTLKLWLDVARWVYLFALRRMLFVTASHIHGSTGFDLYVIFSAPFLIKLVLFSSFCEQLSCFGHTCYHVVFTMPSCSGKAAKTCFCHQMDKKVGKN